LADQHIRPWLGTSGQLSSTQTLQSSLKAFGGMGDKSVAQLMTRTAYAKKRIRRFLVVLASK